MNSEKVPRGAHPSWRTRRYYVLWLLTPCLFISLLLLGHSHPPSPKHPYQPHERHTEPLSSDFQIKHIFHHGAGKNHRLHRRLDVTPQFIAETEKMMNEQAELYGHDQEAELHVEDFPKPRRGQNPWSASIKIKDGAAKSKAVRLKERHTPHFLDSYLEYAMRVKGNPSILNKINLEWEPETDIRVPDIEDKDTVVSLATISSNAYVKMPQNEKEKKNSDWMDVGDPWEPDTEHSDVNFGWLDNGLRGHVFVSNDSKTVVIGIKGTSGAFLPGGGSDDTAGNDKTNDNLLFSCCCARVGYTWTTVCDCYEKTYTCNQDCLERELLRQDRYYQAALDIYRNVTKLYPPEKTDIWVTGHSLGGALASLVGRTYGLPVVAFEAPGEQLATQRLHLPKPPGIPRFMEHIWHFGNTADPIFMGSCNGASSSCSIAGYAMETACHTGKLCVYDVVTDKGWHVNLMNHRIHTVIDDIILAYNETAKCVDQPHCRDCFNWRYTSHDENEPDEPKFPNPFKPKPSKSAGGPTKTTSIGTSTSTSTDPAKKCLERTWYGWCTKWGDDEDE